MEHVSWYGPVYLEASRMEEKRNELGRAIEIVQRGLTEMPKYGPLWFRYTLLSVRTAFNHPIWAENMIRTQCPSIVRET